ncbi:MAG: histidine phosphatase family protein [Rhodospirillales bacterium]|nr:histidine phosphatase family protein [Rhodospirillales bacterium]
MTRLALLRHAPTDWNAARRLQGRADIAISEASREMLLRRTLPPQVAGFRSLASPLRRCVVTAWLLDLDPQLDPRLAEMDWGEFEGRTLPELRDRLGPDLADNEARGLDFRPPGGESPRDVQARVMPLLGEIAAAGMPTLAVTHRGIIRAIYACATGWDMTGDSSDKLDFYAMHIFTLAPDGAPRIETLNLSLVDK